MKIKSYYILFFIVALFSRESFTNTSGTSMGKKISNSVRCDQNVCYIDEDKSEVVENTSNRQVSPSGSLRPPSDNVKSLRPPKKSSNGLEISGTPNFLQSSTTLSGEETTGVSFESIPQNIVRGENNENPQIDICSNDLKSDSGIAVLSKQMGEIEKSLSNENPSKDQAQYYIISAPAVCAPCKRLQEYLKNINERYKGLPTTVIDFEKFDTDRFFSEIKKIEEKHKAKLEGSGSSYYPFIIKYENKRLRTERAEYGPIPSRKKEETPHYYIISATGTCGPCRTLEGQLNRSGGRYNGQATTVIDFLYFDSARYEKEIQNLESKYRTKMRGSRSASYPGIILYKDGALIREGGAAFNPNYQIEKQQETETKEEKKKDAFEYDPKDYMI